MTAFGKCTPLKSIATVSHSPEISMAFAYHGPIKPTTHETLRQYLVRIAYIDDGVRQSPCGRCPQGDAFFSWLWRGGSAAGFEPPTVVAGLSDVAMMGNAVEQRGRHFGVAEHRGPFPNARLVVTITKVCS